MHIGKALILCSCWLLVSCVGREGTDYSRVFRYNESKGITTLDPAFARYQALIWPVTQLYNGLVQVNDSLDVVPCIARSWEVKEHGKKYLFHLRNDVFFHDDTVFPAGKGRKLTAEDVVYSLNRLLDPSIASPGSWVLNEVDTKLPGTSHGIRAINDSTVLICLKRSFPPFLGILTTPYCFIVPREAVDSYGPDFRSHPVGTGPFRMKVWYEGEKLILVKNEHYFEYDHNGGRLPYLDAVAITFIPDKQSEFLEFLKGNLDYISGVNAAFKDELITRSGHLNPKYSSRFKMTIYPYLNTEYLGFLVDTSLPAVKNSPLADRRIRQAINYGFDRVKMMKFLRNSLGKPALNGFIPAGLPGFTDSLHGYLYNPDQARRLLAEAGYPEGKGLPPLTVLTTGDYLDLIEYIQHELEQVGINIRIEVSNGPGYREAISNARAPFFRGSWVADYPDAENYFALFYSRNFSPAGPNYFHFKNTEFDQLYEQYISNIDPSLRLVYSRKMDSLIIDEAPVVPLFYDMVVRFSAKGVTGMSMNPMNLLILKYIIKKN
ncbi:MAG: ABC transporter substrate-binding protein [Bacteroidales bacterium]|nr:ABC transporter substrate-binding protein [Bacteroidales bacterium]